MVLIHTSDDIADSDFGSDGHRGDLHTVWILLLKEHGKARDLTQQHGACEKQDGRDFTHFI